MKRKCGYGGDDSGLVHTHSVKGLLWATMPPLSKVSKLVVLPRLGICMLYYFMCRCLIFVYGCFLSIYNIYRILNNIPIHYARVAVYIIYTYRWHKYYNTLGFVCCCCYIVWQINQSLFTTWIQWENRTVKIGLGRRQRDDERLLRVSMENEM